MIKALTRVKLIESIKDCNFSRSGRTDKGVSAFAQVFALDVRSMCTDGIGIVALPTATERVAATADAPDLDYANILNQQLPKAIRVTAWTRVALNFDAR